MKQDKVLMFLMMQRTFIAVEHSLSNGKEILEKSFSSGLKH